MCSAVCPLLPLVALWGFSVPIMVQSDVNTVGISHWNTKCCTAREVWISFSIRSSEACARIRVQFKQKRITSHAARKREKESSSSVPLFVSDSTLKMFSKELKDFQRSMSFSNMVCSFTSTSTWNPHDSLNNKLTWLFFRHYHRVWCWQMGKLWCVPRGTTMCTYYPVCVICFSCGCLWPHTDLHVSLPSVIFTPSRTAGGRTHWWVTMMPSVKCVGSMTGCTRRPGIPPSR